MTDFSHVNLDDHIHSEIGSVKILSWTFDLYEDGVDEYSDESMQLFKSFLEEKDIYFYARPRESFHRSDAISKALIHDKSYLLMEDLS